MKVSKPRLKPYWWQREGVRAIQKFGGRAILGDEMGLGKTQQALWYFHKRPKRRPVVIICPAVAKYDWAAEGHQHFGMDIRVLEGFRPRKCHKVQGDIIVLNYEILKSWLPVLLKMKPQILILDELHYLQNPDSARTLAAKELSDGEDVAAVVGITGTPIFNELIGLWSPLNIIRPDLFPYRLKFAWRYTRPRKYRGMWMFKGAKRKSEIRRILLKECLIRRLKKDVAKDLPDKVHKIVHLKLKPADQKKYRFAHNPKTFLHWIERKFNKARAIKAKRNRGMARVGYLMRFCAELKMELGAQWIEEWKAAHPGKKLVVMSMNTRVIDFLHKRFPDSVVINGKVRGLKRQEAKRKFQNNPKITFCFGNWKAAGIAITLTAAHHLVAFDLPYTEGDLLQGQDRIHRIGQKDTCVIYYLMLLDTIEQLMFDGLKAKTAIFEAIFNGGKSTKEFDIFKWLVKKLNNEDANQRRGL